MLESGESASAPSSAVTDQLVDSHRLFLGFLERRLGDRALAEDILQDAFVRRIERGFELRDDEAAKAWFYRMLRNAVIDHHRRARVRHQSLEMLAREMRDASAPSPELNAAICTCIAKLAATLKPEYAAAIQRVEVDEASLQTFAKENGITANNAGVRISRARAELRKRVRASCGTCAEHGCVDCTCGR